MPFPSALMNGLMAGANFGQGYFQGKDQAQALQDQEAQRQMNEQMTALKMQTMRQGLQNQQGLQQDTQQLQGNPDTANLSPDKKFDLLANQALARGDINAASKLVNQADTIRSAQLKQNQTQSAIDTGQANNQQKVMQYIGGPLAAAAEQGPDAFEKEKLQIYASGMITPENVKKLANMQWTPTTANQLRMFSMTAQQQAQDQIAKQKAQTQQQNDIALQASRAMNTKIAAQRLADQERRTAVLEKAGGGAKGPSAQDLSDTDAFLADSGLDPKSPEYGQAQQSLIDTAASIKKTNPNISRSQAMQQASALIKKQDITQGSKGGLFGGGTSASYKMAGATPQSAIPYTGDKSSLIPGRYYKTGNKGVVQFTGTGFVPVQ